MATHTHSPSDAIFSAAADGADAATKTVRMPVGIPGYTLREEERTVPASEPPVLPLNKDLEYIGKPIERWDGLQKATGRARYTADVQLPGMLYARFVNSTVPHAKVVSIDTTDAEKHPGVKAVYVIENVMGNAVLRDPSLEQTKYPVVRYAGQPIAADGETCKRAVVAMGAASPVVRRSAEAEAALAGKPITQESARAAGKASMTNAMPLSMNAYKVQLFPVAVYRTILLAAGQMDRDPSAAG